MKKIELKNIISEAVQDIFTDMYKQEDKIRDILEKNDIFDGQDFEFHMGRMWVSTEASPKIVKLLNSGGYNVTEKPHDTGSEIIFGKEDIKEDSGSGPQVKISPAGGAWSVEWIDGDGKRGLEYPHIDHTARNIALKKAEELGLKPEYIEDTAGLLKLKEEKIMKKTELKKLIKECVQEVLNEFINADPMNFYYKLNRSPQPLDRRNADIWKAFIPTLSDMQKSENPRNPGVFDNNLVDKAVAEYLKKEPRVKANLEVLSTKFKDFVEKEQLKSKE